MDDLKVDLDKNIIFLDSRGRQIFIFDLYGNFLCTLGKKGEQPGDFGLPTSIAVDNRNNIFVSDLSQKRISKFNLDTGFVNSFIISGTQNEAFSLRINSKGFIFIKGFNRRGSTDLESGMWINKYDPKGKYLTSFFPSNKCNINWVWRIAPFCSFDIDNEDIIYAVQHCDYEISEYNLECRLLKKIGIAPSYFKRPNIKGKIDFKMFKTRDELANKLKMLTVSWTKLIDIVVIRNKYILLILEMNNLVKEIDKKYVIDIWDKEGNFIAGGLQTDHNLICRDFEGYLYFLIRGVGENSEKKHQYIIGKYALNLK